MDSWVVLSAEGNGIVMLPHPHHSHHLQSSHKIVEGPLKRHYLTQHVMPGLHQPWDDYACFWRTWDWCYHLPSGCNPQTSWLASGQHWCISRKRLSAICYHSSSLSHSQPKSSFPDKKKKTQPLKAQVQIQPFQACSRSWLEWLKLGVSRPQVQETFGPFQKLPNKKLKTKSYKWRRPKSTIQKKAAKVSWSISMMKKQQQKGWTARSVKMIVMYRKVAKEYLKNNVCFCLVCVE